MVAMIMMRTLHRDISKYNQLETAEEAQEETGWKLVRCYFCDGGAAVACVGAVRPRAGVVAAAVLLWFSCSMCLLFLVEILWSHIASSLLCSSHPTWLVCPRAGHWGVMLRCQSYLSLLQLASPCCSHPAGAWRCVPAALAWVLAGCAGGHWRAAVWYDPGDDVVCHAGLPVPRQSWRPDDGGAAAVRLHGLLRWLLLCPPIQDLQGAWAHGLFTLAMSAFCSGTTKVCNPFCCCLAIPCRRASSGSRPRSALR